MLTIKKFQKFANRLNLSARKLYQKPRPAWVFHRANKRSFVLADGITETLVVFPKTVGGIQVNHQHLTEPRKNVKTTMSALALAAFLRKHYPYAVASVFNANDTRCGLL